LKAPKAPKAPKGLKTPPSQKQTSSARRADINAKTPDFSLGQIKQNLSSLGEALYGKIKVKQ
ncbi:MAG: hypothetical protein K2L17_07055, partial [Muribaculaceae bacterium]|nr:hypothetical protein [Muribaculaceae bacterium]